MKVNKEIKRLTGLVRGETEVKRKIFEVFKGIHQQRSEERKVERDTIKHMKLWKKFMALKSWQNIKQYEAKEQEKTEKAIELLNKRKRFRVFTYFKLGTVYSRISDLDKRL